MKKYYIMTNNPLVAAEYSDRMDIRLIDGSYEDVLCCVRDMCHQGCRLLSHPLSGSVKPNETPFKSIMLSYPKEGTDIESVQLIEKALYTCRKFGAIRRNWREKELEDFKVIDKTLIDSAIESAALGLI